MALAEDLAAEREFVPPFCPHPTCPFHRRGDHRHWRFARRGYRRVQRAPGRIRRFRCSSCGGWFSSSTFREDYWTKRPGLSAAVYDLIADGKGLRQAARTLRVSPTTVKRRQRWLARQALLAHLQLMRRLQGRLDEPVVLDGMRTFAGSQHEVAELNTFVAAGSGLHLELDAIPLRRMGRMTAAQREERARRDRRLGRPDPRARERITLAGLSRLRPLLAPDRTLVLLTDEEPAYGRAVARARHTMTIDHETVSSRRRRDSSNPLWRVNHLHRFQRHSLANLKRETIAHSKVLAGLLDRALIHRCFANFTKGVSERRAEASRTTPAMQLGLARRPLRGEELFRLRRFPRRAGLTEELRVVYEGRLRARPREHVRPYVPKVAY